MGEETIPQMQERIDNQNREIAGQTKTIQTLNLENRRLLARDVAREKGYDASAGELFASANPEADINEESLAEFINKFPGLAGGGTASTEGESTDSGDEGDEAEQSAVGSGDLSKLARGGSRSGDSADGAAQQTMTIQEWQKLSVTDPAAAKEAVRQSRVQVSRDNPYGDQIPVPAGVNPYQPSAQE